MEMARTEAQAVLIAQRTRCAICGAGGLEVALELPDLPLTGIYAPTPMTEPIPGIPQRLLVCARCGHGQLANQVSPEFLYGQSYSFRTSRSHTATQGTTWFLSMLEEIASGRRFECVVDVGCNDLHLLRKLEGLARIRIGVDPIWKSREDQREDPEIRVIGSSIEEMDVAGLGAVPDLIVCRHTLEHIAEPVEFLTRLLAVADERTMFVIEVPGFEALVHRLRFDQVFHQHLHYFNLASFQRILRDLGATYVAHREHYHDWGALLVAFTKGHGAGDESVGSWFDLAAIRQRYALFRQNMAAACEALRWFEGTLLYGYGAAQMLPVLAYHLGTDLSMLTAVLDDDPAKDGVYYWNLPLAIRHTGRVQDLESSTVLLTALDNVKPIMQKLMARRPRHVLIPLQAI